MTVSKPEIWAGSDRDPIDKRRMPFLRRYFLYGKERTEHGLLAIEIALWLISGR
jgi:hypothetical protein